MNELYYIADKSEVDWVDFWLKSGNKIFWFPKRRTYVLDIPEIWQNYNDKQNKLPKTKNTITILTY